MLVLFVEREGKGKKKRGNEVNEVKLVKDKVVKSGKIWRGLYERRWLAGGFGDSRWRGW